MEKTNYTNQDIAQMLLQMLCNQQAIAAHLGITLADVPHSINNVRVEDSPLTRLRRKMLYPQAFDKAVQQGLIEVVGDDHLVSHFNSNTELAFFLGLITCGDRVCKGVWVAGKIKYPDGLLTSIFGYSVRTIRKNRINSKIFKNYFYITNLL